MHVKGQWFRGWLGTTSVTMLFNSTKTEDGGYEFTDEEFEVGTRFVTYTELVEQFGQAKVDSFVTLATRGGRRQR